MKWKSRKLAALAIAAASTLLSPGQAEAILASVKSTGMAATATSYPLDSLAAAYNPAGISFVEDRVDVEGAWEQSRQHAVTQDNLLLPPFPPLPNPLTNGYYDGSKTKDYYVGNFGVVKHIPWCVTLGLVGYNRQFVKTTYGKPNLLLGHTKPGLEYLHEVISPGIAVRLWKNHSLGVTLNVNLQRFKVNGVQNFDNGLLSVAPGFVTNNGYNWSSGVGVTIGWLSKFWCDRIGVGVAYTPHGHMSKFRRYRGFYAQGGEFNLPQRWIVGVSWRWIPCSTIAVDVEWDNWKQIKALHNPLAADLFANKLGSENGTGFGFKNQTFIRVGMDYKLWNCLTLRAGYRHVNLPFSRTQTAVNILLLDCVKDYVTCGFTWEYRAFELSGLYAHGFRNTVKGKDSIPAILGGGNANLEQETDILGLALGYKY